MNNLQNKKTIKLTLLAAFMAAFSFQAAAEAIPRSSSKDSRVQTVSYDPNDVVSIRGQVGRAVLIQLEADERLEGDAAALGMGDSEAWNLAVKGNNIIFKPTANSPATNMIVTTNKRTYVFNLSLQGATNKKGKSIQTPTYVLRFDYPDTRFKETQAQQAKNAQVLALMQKVDPSHKVTESSVNQNYWGKGSQAIAPTAAYDNGRFTFFSFNNGKDLPTIYKVLPDGSESLLNTHVEEDTVVVHEMAKHYVFRLGNEVLGIENRSFDSVGSFNRTGTSDGDTIRMIK